MSTNDQIVPEDKEVELPDVPRAEEESLLSAEDVKKKIEEVVDKAFQKPRVAEVPATGTVSLSSRDVLLWKNPYISGGIFLIGNLFFFLVTFGGYSVMSIFSYLLMLEIGISFLYVNFFAIVSNLLFKKPYRKGASEGPVGRQVYVSKSLVQKQLEALAPLFADLENTAVNTLLCTDNVLALKGLGALFVVAQVGRFFSTLTLLYLGFLGAFTLPKLYELKQKEVDEVVASGKQQLTSAYSTLQQSVIQKIPRASELMKKGQ
mmetsp:Transcript_22539/g.37213  ORF Transcript_22539/g.37213 Transcript_22539/m.37213 type:complete len:262 (-) Transcript_22539:206-991(-)|eukprot:CAMPEP_0184650902 /NCGR_PEP_ID=MMETSP0308-20130426/8475_1 /TAXON_ID=38269 /ORGANISM="Gloeochaete witrockiana, Strain SAG 46.84" /LENGTH=261 /DNA_ID=CAMNT_0027084757 /DNA_START=83 /DNA_END=868 /DNA_ORIENTATION=+